MKTIGAALFSLSLCTGASAGCYQQLKERFPVAGTIVFGEVHGSAEIPQFVVDCAREFAANTEQVRVFLEFPAADNENVDKFARGEINVEELTRSRHWRVQDGRASRAMLRLVEDLKSARIPVAGVDGGGGDREQAMARNFVGAYSRTGYNLVLVGNVHARLVNGMPWDAKSNVVPFAKQLRDQGVDLVSLDSRYPSGSAWNCSPDCGVHAATGSSDNGGATIVFSKDAPAYSGYFRTASITASRPVHEK